MDLEEMGWDGVNWIHGAQDGDWYHAPVNIVTNMTS
jgi:hypothetical protein